MRLLYGLGADDDELNASVQVGIDRLLVADATADLDRQVGKGLRDAADHLGIDRLPGEGAVQVHHMQAAGAGPHPAFGHGHRVVGEDRRILHASPGAAARIYRLSNRLRVSATCPGSSSSRPVQVGSALQVPVGEIGEQSQSGLSTFFRMELHGEDVVARDRRGEVETVPGSARARWHPQVVDNNCGRNRSGCLEKSPPEWVIAQLDGPGSKPMCGTLSRSPSTGSHAARRTRPPGPGNMSRPSIPPFSSQRSAAPAVPAQAQERFAPAPLRAPRPPDPSGPKLCACSRGSSPPGNTTRSACRIS